MAHDLDRAKVFDVNGTKYRVGLDEHGFVQIQTGELWRNPETGDDEFHAYDKGDNLAPHVMFDRGTARAMVDHIETLLEG